METYNPVYNPVFINSFLLGELDTKCQMTPEKMRMWEIKKENNKNKERDISYFLGLEEFTNIERFKETKRFSKGDMVYKIDLIFSLEGSLYGVQLKSSKCGKDSFYQKYGKGIKSKIVIPCPKVFIPERSLKFYNYFINEVGAEWKPEVAKTITKLEKLKASGIKKVPDVIFSLTEKRFLKFIGLINRGGNYEI